MTSEEETIKEDYVSLKNNARKVWEEIHTKGTQPWRRHIADRDEKHIRGLVEGFYKNIPDYVEDGDFWLIDELETNDKSDSFWDFL